MMRAVCLLLLLLSALASAQPSRSGTDLLITITPNARTDTDLVEMSAVKPGYPQPLMQGQAEELGRRLGVPARGFIGQNYKIGAQVFTKCTFGTNGLVDKQTGKLRLTPILQALVGAPEPFTVKGLIIIFQGVTPTTDTLKEFGSPGVRLVANATGNPPQIEYRVDILSQNPDEVTVPDGVREQKLPPTPSTVQHKGFDWSLWLPILAAALAASFIVYFLLLRASPRRRG